MSVPKMTQQKLHPAEELFGWLIVQVGIMHRNFEKSSYIEVRQKLHELYDTAYKLGYEQGQEDEHGESRRPLGK